MTEITDYQAVQAKKINDLNKEVNKLLSLGYQPFGSISSSITWDDDDEDTVKLFSQAMVKYKIVN